MVRNQRYLLHSLVEFGGRYIYHNHHDDINYQRICSKHMDKSIKQFLIKISMIFTGYTAAVMGPIYAFMVYGIRTTTIEAVVPFTEEKSWGEFTVNSILQMVNATHGGFIYLGIEVVMDIFSNIITILPHLTKLKLKKIMLDYTENRMTPSQLRFAVKDVVKQCNDANEYVSIHFYH